MFAAEIMIMNENSDESMLVVENDNTVEFGVKFGMDKCLITSFIDYQVNVDNTWRQGENDGRRTSAYIYLGEALSVKGYKKAKCEKIFKANQCHERFASVQSRVKILRVRFHQAIQLKSI